MTTKSKPTPIFPKKITMEIIPQEAQRYETLGDYWVDPQGNWEIRASDECEAVDALLVFLHEFVELMLMTQRGITEESVLAFDKEWCKQHPDYPFNDLSEPGDCLDAPYNKEHRFASLIECLMAHELGDSQYGIVKG